MLDKKTILDNFMKQAHQKGGFNGTWLYAENGDIISKGALGWMNNEDSLPMQEDSIFNLASISKQFTATAIMLLLKEGKLRLDDDIQKYFPSIPFKGVTIKHLLTHTSGLPEFYTSDGWIVQTCVNERIIPTNDIIIRYICESNLELDFTPGKQYKYSNTGYSLLAEIVKIVSEIPFEIFLQKYIFEPAGMKSTEVHHVCKDRTLSNNIVSYQIMENESFIPIEKSEYCSKLLYMDGMNGFSSVYSNIIDLFIWDRALRNEKILSHKEQQQMYSICKLSDGKNASRDIKNVTDGYGFGWEISNDRDFKLIVKHSGRNPGGYAWIERFVDFDKVFVILCNRDNTDFRAFNSLTQGLEEIAKDNSLKSITTIDDIIMKKPDKSKWDSFCGKYYSFPECRIFPVEEVLSKNGELYARIDCYIYKLYPKNNNTFIMKEKDYSLMFDYNRFTLIVENNDLSIRRYIFLKTI